MPSTDRFELRRLLIGCAADWRASLRDLADVIEHHLAKQAGDSVWTSLAECLLELVEGGLVTLRSLDRVERTPVPTPSSRSTQAVLCLFRHEELDCFLDLTVSGQAEWQKDPNYPRWMHWSVHLRGLDFSPHGRFISLDRTPAAAGKVIAAQSGSGTEAKVVLYADRNALFHIGCALIRRSKESNVDENPHHLEVMAPVSWIGIELVLHVD